MHLFYQPNFQEIAALTEDEALHAAKVLRLRVGEAVRITDGQGRFFEGTLQTVTPKKCDITNATVSTVAPPPYQIEIALAPTKNLDRIEWLLEKATEIGVTKVSFFYSERSERRQMKLERLQKIAVSAMKQSLQAYLPQVEEVGNFEKWLRANATATNAQKFIAHLPENEQPPHLFRAAAPGQHYLVLVGPEGDFSKTELSLAQELGFQNVVLGKTRLRTETAALVACQILNTLNV
jgi:16S rRNA (uracil1498-N3)-methyltransferase